jgi:hypothetical protein
VVLLAFNTVRKVAILSFLEEMSAFKPITSESRAASVSSGAAFSLSELLEDFESFIWSLIVDLMRRTCSLSV